MHRGNIAVAGIFILSAVGLSACDGGDPTTTGSTPPAVVQSEEAPTQAMPAPAEGESAPASESTNSGG